MASRSRRVVLYPKPGEAPLSRKKFREDRPQHKSVAPSPLGELLDLLRAPGGLRKPFGKPPRKSEMERFREEKEAAKKTADRRAQIEEQVWRKYGMTPDSRVRSEPHYGEPMTLLDGGWGVRIKTDDPVRLGDPVNVIPKTAMGWTAEVIEIVWQGKGCANVKTGTPGIAAKVEIRKRLANLQEPGSRAPGPRRRKRQVRGSGDSSWGT